MFHFFSTKPTDGFILVENIKSLEEMKIVPQENYITKSIPIDVTVDDKNEYFYFYFRIDNSYGKGRIKKTATPYSSGMILLFDIKMYLNIETDKNKKRNVTSADH